MNPRERNDPVLKTVCLTGTGVRIPQPAPKNTNFSVGVFLFFILNLCAVIMGEEQKTVDNCFSRTKSTKQGEMKKIYDFSAFRLCDLTGESSNPEDMQLALVVNYISCSAPTQCKRKKQKSKSNKKFNLDLCCV